MLAKTWALIKDTILGFLADEALSRAAAIAYFTIFSIAPLLIAVTAIAGTLFGYAAARQAIVAQFNGLMGERSAELLRTMIEQASTRDTGLVATAIGVGMLLLSTSGAFGEIQAALNKIWKAKPEAGFSRLLRARLTGLGLVLTLGFVMLVSLIVSAGLAALGDWINVLFAGAETVIAGTNFLVSLALLSVLFAAIFKLLPDTDIAWRDVAIGALATAILFTIGKTAIGIYIGRSEIASGFGAAGALIVMLVWLYYSSLIFLLGAEFTRAYAERHGSHADGADATSLYPPASLRAAE